MQEESTLVHKLNTTRDNAAKLLTSVVAAAVAGSTLVRNLDTTSTNSTTPVAAAATAAAAGVLSMTTVGKGDDAETEKARISAVLSESNKSSSHQSSSNISIRDKYSATNPKMLLQKKNVQLQKLVQQRNQEKGDCLATNIFIQGLSGSFSRVLDGTKAQFLMKN